MDSGEWERDLRAWGVKDAPLKKLKKKPADIRMAYHEILKPGTFAKCVREIQKRVNTQDPGDLEEIIVFQLARILDNLINESEKKHKFDDEDSVHGYLVGMINNQSNKLIGNLMKEASRRALFPADLSATMGAEEDDWQIVLEQVFALSLKYRSVLLPRLLEHTIAEIAKLVGIRENTVKSRLRRARRLLADQLEQLKVGGAQ